jgi:proline iminopeptidase
MRSMKWFGAVLLAFGIGACDTLDPRDPGNLVPPTVTEDPSLPAIEMNGSRFHLETRGNPANPVIVFLHGGPGSDYRSLLRLGERHNGYSLADQYFLVYWDQRGAGLSRRHNRDVLTLDVYLNDLKTVIDRFSPGRPVILLGVSWGGMYATQYINTYPEGVAGAILIEPGPLDGPTYERIKGDLFDLDFGAEWLNDYAWSGQFISPDDHIRMDYERLLGLREGQPRFHMRTDVDPEPVWRLGAAVNRYLIEDGKNDQGIAVYDFTTNLSRFTRPVLFIAGTLNEVIGEAFQREQVLRYPSASLAVVPDAGHDLAWTHTAEVLTHVRGYLDALQGVLP